MNKTITIDPVTRIEGHAKVFLNLDDEGQLASAGLVVNELRGFERILVGMTAEQMPLVTARICGVCPTAHHLAATNALDHAAGVEPPPAGKMLRELMYMGHVIHSHALSLYILQGPDLVLGLDSDPALRNIVGIVKANPDLAKKALRIRSLGQKINELVGGRGVHPVTSVVGGCTFDMDHARHQTLLQWVDEGLALLDELVPLTRGFLLKMTEKNPAMLSDWTSPVYSMSTIDHRGLISLYDGHLRATDLEGKIFKEFPVQDYHLNLAESVAEWSYMKHVHLKDGEARIPYRVGPLARVNSGAKYGTELADAEVARMREQFGFPCHLIVMQTYARLIELIYAFERAHQLLHDPAIHGETRVPVKWKGGRGCGHVEAARGTLIHDYEIDEDGIVRAANLIVATQQNHSSIDRVIAAAAASHVIGKSDDEMLLNAVEFGVRCFDPCLSCATHEVGGMPLEVSFMKGGQQVRSLRRGC